jgi:hypothetical protein
MCAGKSIRVGLQADLQSLMNQWGSQLDFMSFIRARAFWSAAGILVALAVAFVIWRIVFIQTGATDPTGEDMYWQWGYPALLLASAMFGFGFRGNGWIYAVVMLLTQLFIVLLFSPKDNPQLPIGLILYVGFAIPLILASSLGAYIAKKVRNQSTSK